MKRANVRVIAGALLAALGAAQSVPAAELIGDGQQQARLLLLGGGASSTGPKAESIAAASGVGQATDGLAQAREMIVGRPIAKAAIPGSGGLRSAGAPQDRQAAGDPHETARRMILGSRTAGGRARVRLTSQD